jgi:hypothetical protein
LQNVPIAVTALISKSLAKTAITSSSDLSSAVPGLALNQNRTVVTPCLRGVGAENSAT